MESKSLRSAFVTNLTTHKFEKLADFEKLYKVDNFPIPNVSIVSLFESGSWALTRQEKNSQTKTSQFKEIYAMPHICDIDVNIVACL